jgi:hypothetical protein
MVNETSGWVKRFEPRPLPALPNLPPLPPRV